MLTSSVISKLRLGSSIDISAILFASRPTVTLVPCLNNQQPVRNYAFKSDLKIKWVRPVKIDCTLPAKSGDLSELPRLDPSQIHEDFEDCKALEDLSEEQRKLYTLGFLPRKKTMAMLLNQAVCLVQRHHLDNGSMEARIAFQTVKIRGLQQHMQSFPKDKISKVFLKELIDKRKKYLKYLRRWDYKRFEWLLEKLDIIYRPPPEEFHWITRKNSLKILTQEHCDGIRDARLAEYRRKLDSEKESFQQEKEELEKWIAEEEKACEEALAKIASNKIANQASA